MEDADEKGSGSVRAVERAIDILLAFNGNDRDLTVGQLLKRVNLSRPTLYRLIYTLVEKGVLIAEGEPQRFRLGPKIGQMAWAWSSSLDVAALARPIMERLQEETMETVALFVLQGPMRVCVAELPSSQPLSFRRGVGYSERLACGAGGRAILAWMNSTPEALERYCIDLDFDASTLGEELRRVQELGYASSNNEMINGAAAIAAPFFDNGNHVVGSIGVFGPTVRLNKERLEQIAQTLMEDARELTRQLGNPLA